MTEKEKKDYDETLEQEARIALLHHFSSKSTNQTTIILTVALASFAFVQTLQLTMDWQEWQRAVYGIPVLTFLSFVAIRACGRLIFWGKLAGFIEVIKPKEQEITAQRIKQNGRESTEKVTWFNRLENGMDDRRRESHLLIISWTLTNSKPGGAFMVLLLLSLWGIVFTSNYLQAVFSSSFAVSLILNFLKIIHTWGKENARRRKAKNENEKKQCCPEKGRDWP